MLRLAGAAAGAAGTGVAGRAAGRGCGRAAGRGSSRSSSNEFGRSGRRETHARLRSRRQPVRGRNRRGRRQRRRIASRRAELEVEIARGRAPGRRRHGGQIVAEVVDLADHEIVLAGIVVQRLHQTEHGGLAVLGLPDGAAEALELGSELHLLADLRRILRHLHERDLDLAEAHHVLVLEHALPDRVAVHGGAVRGAEVLDRPGAARAIELGVPAGEGSVVDRDVVLRRAPDGHVLRIPDDDPLRPARLEHEVGVDAFPVRGRRHADPPRFSWLAFVRIGRRGLAVDGGVIPAASRPDLPVLPPGARRAPRARPARAPYALAHDGPPRHPPGRERRREGGGLPPSLRHLRRGDGALPRPGGSRGPAPGRARGRDRAHLLRRRGGWHRRRDPAAELGRRRALQRAADRELPARAVPGRDGARADRGRRARHGHPAAARERDLSRARPLLAALRQREAHRADLRRLRAAPAEPVRRAGLRGPSRRRTSTAPRWAS